MWLPATNADKFRAAMMPLSRLRSPDANVDVQAIAAGVEPKSSLSAAALGIHSLLVSEGFICTGQDEKAAPLKGFAAPARDVPEDKLVPDQW